MSMNTYPLEDVGLILDAALVAVISLYDKDPEKTKKDLEEILLYDPSVPTAAYADFWNAVDLLRDNNIEVITCSQFDGSAETIEAEWKNPDEKIRVGSETGSWSWEDDPMAYIPIENRPTLFSGGYGSPDDILFELENKLMPGLVPETMSLRSRIVRISGTYFC